MINGPSDKIDQDATNALVASANEALLSASRQAGLVAAAALAASPVWAGPPPLQLTPRFALCLLIASILFSVGTHFYLGYTLIHIVQGIQAGKRIATHSIVRAAWAWGFFQYASLMAGLVTAFLLL